MDGPFCRLLKVFNSKTAPGVKLAAHTSIRIVKLIEPSASDTMHSRQQMWKKYFNNVRLFEIIETHSHPILVEYAGEVRI